MSNSLILDKLEGVNSRFNDVGRMLTEPDVVNDMKRYIQLNREYKELKPIIEVFKEYKDLISNINTAKDILATEKDEEL